MEEFNGTKDSLSELTDIFDEIQDSLEDKVSVHRFFLTKILLERIQATLFMAAGHKNDNLHACNLSQLHRTV